MPRPFTHAHDWTPWELVPEESIVDAADVEEAAVVDRLLATQAELSAGPPTSILEDCKPTSLSAEAIRVRDRYKQDDGFDEDDLIYTVQESIIRQELQEKGGKRPISHVDRDEVEDEQNGQDDPDYGPIPAQSDRQLPPSTPAKTVSIQYEFPPRERRRLSAIEEIDEDEVGDAIVPMEGTTSGFFSSSKPSSPAVSPSPPTSNGLPWKRQRLTPAVREQPEEVIAHVEPSTLQDEAVAAVPDDERDDESFQSIATPEAPAKAGLAHFVSSRGRGHLFESSHGSATSVFPSAAMEADPTAIVEGEDETIQQQVETTSGDKVPLPANPSEFDTAWLSGGVAPGEHTAKAPPVLHVVSGQRLLQNRTGSQTSALLLLTPSMIFRRTHSLLFPASVSAPSPCFHQC